jgi:hypothetical protein
MAYKSFLILLVLGIAMFSGCVDNPSKTVYVSTKTNHTLVLYSDKTFTYQENDGVFGGTYRFEGDHLFLTFQAFGNVFDFKKHGNDLIEVSDGTLWIKK